MRLFFFFFEGGVVCLGFFRVYNISRYEISSEKGKILECIAALPFHRCILEKGRSLCLLQNFSTNSSLQYCSDEHLRGTGSVFRDAGIQGII